MDNNIKKLIDDFKSININNNNIINNFNNDYKIKLEDILLDENKSYNIYDNNVLWKNQINDINLMLIELLLVKNTRIKLTSCPSSGKTISILYLIKIIKSVINNFSVLLIVPNNLFMYWLDEIKKINLNNCELVFQKTTAYYNILIQNYHNKLMTIKNKMTKTYLIDNKELFKNNIFVVSSLEYDSFIKTFVSYYNFTFDLVVIDEYSTIQSRDMSSTFPISVNNIILIDSAEKKNKLTRKLNFVSHFVRLNCVEINTAKLDIDDLLIPEIIDIKVRPKNILKFIDDENLKSINIIYSEEYILKNKYILNYTFSDIKEKVLIELYSEQINIFINMYSILIKFYFTNIKLLFKTALNDNNKIKFKNYNDIINLINNNNINEIELNKNNLNINFETTIIKKTDDNNNNTNYNDIVYNYLLSFKNEQSSILSFKNSNELNNINLNNNKIDENVLYLILNINFLTNIEQLLDINLLKMIVNILKIDFKNIINDILSNETNKNIINSKDELINFISNFLILINYINIKTNDIYKYDFEDTCYLCLENESDILTEPCKHLYHSKCLEYINKDSVYMDKCYCGNNKITINKIDKFDKNNLLPPAYEKAFEIINENINNKKIVVFVDDFNEFLLEELLIKNKINFENIGFRKLAAVNALKKFNDRSTDNKKHPLNLLILNKNKAAEGLNLQEADLLIMVSIPSTPELKTQIYGRCLRHGRTNKLTIYNLIKFK